MGLNKQVLTARRRIEGETVEATPIECPAPLAGCRLHFDGLNTSDKLSTASRSRSGLRGGIVCDVPLAGFQYDVSLRSTSPQPALAWQASARRYGSVASTARIAAYQNVCLERTAIDTADLRLSSCDWWQGAWSIGKAWRVGVSDEYPPRCRSAMPPRPDVVRVSTALSLGDQGR